MAKRIVTVCIPCYNEEENVRIAYETVKNIVTPLRNYNFKYLFSDNGSTDKTRSIITALAKKDKKVKGVFLSRNFGIEASFAALVDNAEGDAMIMLFCDLQDPAELIPQFIKKWEEGNNMVVAKYTNTEDDAVTLMLRKAFYFVFRRISNIDVPVNASGVGLLDRKSIDVLKSLPEKYRFFRGLRAWIGFKSAFVLYHRKKRERGVSSYNFMTLIQHAERGVYGFSYLFLDFMSYSGLIVSGIVFLAMVIYLATTQMNGGSIHLSVLTFLSVAFFGSLQFMGIGIIGKYIQVVLEESKNRPVYVVDKIIGGK